jgi:hypothetical protein
LIEQLTDVEDYAIFYNNSSLFHQFSNRNKVALLIFDKFISRWNDINFYSQERNIALGLLTPNSNKDTALKLALDTNRFRTFEIMLSLLSKFKHIALSKMFIDQMPYMLQSESGLLFDYFNDKKFVPRANEDAMRIYWPNDLE